MIIHTANIGHRFERFMQGLNEPGFAHRFVQAAAAEVTLVQRLHRQMQHDFFLFDMGQQRQALGKRGIRDDADRDLARELDDPLAVMQAITEVIDDDRDLGTIVRSGGPL